VTKLVILKSRPDSKPSEAL